MRNTVLMITSAILGMLMLLIVSTIYGRMDRIMELESNVSSIVEETVENMVLDPSYKNQNVDVFLTELEQMISTAIDTPSDIRIDVLQCDTVKGILSVRVTLFYTYPNGNLGTVSCEKHAILNQLIEEEKENFRVIFYVGSDIYKEYVIAEETIINSPVPPIMTEGAFGGWVDEGGKTVDFSQPVRQDIICYAITG